MLGKKILLYYIVIWLSISSASIFVLLSKAPGSICAFYRLLFTTIILTPIWFRGKKFFNPYSLLAGFFLAMHFILWMESLYMVPVLISTVLVVTYPFYNLLIDYLFFHEKISILQILGLVIGFTSILLYYNPVFSKDLDILGITYAIVAGFLASLYFSIGRYLRRWGGTGLTEYVFPTYLSATLVTLLYNLYHGIVLTGYGLETYIYFILLALIPMLGGHTLMNYLLKHLKTSTITSIALGEPIGASLLAYLVFGQTTDLYKIFLSILILSSIALIIYGEEK